MMWAALTDVDLREHLLNRQRRQVMEAFNLSNPERQVITSINADTLDALAEALCRLGIADVR